jgi:hypothetical protein
MPVSRPKCRMKVALDMELSAANFAMPRAKILGEPRDLVKFVVDTATDRVLGAALLSVASQELVNTVVPAIRHGVTASELREAVDTHPALDRGLRRGAGRPPGSPHRAPAAGTPPSVPAGPGRWSPPLREANRLPVPVVPCLATPGMIFP